MRSRSNSGVRLDYYQRVVQRTILSKQNAVSGLLSTTSSSDHSWVRDNCYSILAVWGLSMAYKKSADLDEDRAKTYELEQSCVKLMRGLLMSMMKQRNKVEKFKESQSPLDSLHAKYSSTTGGTVVGDSEWGHLQLDATSLYLLLLAQMTASGLQIIFNLDEVAFIQNLVFYIESAYCIPDYGIWERGDKTNHGLPELNASSIGMAKAALEAINELDLFGARGGPSSVIHVLADEAQKCHAVLQSMLPRESNSKEVDAALLSIISFPAFAVEDPDLIRLTRETIVEKLQGRYGCKRFLRDGYKTAREDPNRLYYEPWELQVFENIECEWPLFFCYLIIDACFRGDREAIKEYTDALDQILVKTDDGFKYVPELYTVPAHKVEQELQNPHSQVREPIGQIPFMWGQSLYILGRLLQEGFLAPGELDPLNRRLSSESKPDVVVQVVILAQDTIVQEKLLEYDIHVQTVAEVAPIEVHPARVLSHIFSYLGKNKKLGLSGRQSRDVGLLSTSKLYMLQDRIFAFTPQNLDREDFFIVNDIALLANIKCLDLAFLRTNWCMLGRPTVTTIITHQHLGLANHSDIFENEKIPTAMISTIKKVKDGYINGTRVTLGFLKDFLSTSCITNLSFLGNVEAGLPEVLKTEVKDYLQKQLSKPRMSTVHPPLPRSPSNIASRTRRSGISGIIRRTRSIQVDKYDPELMKLRANYQKTQMGSALGPVEDEVDRTRLSPIPYTPVMEEEENPLTGYTPSMARVRTLSDRQYDHITEDELLTMLRDSQSVDEQGDLLHYLVVAKGIDWNTPIDKEDNSSPTVKDMLKEVYEKACHEKKWSLVRHIAGMLGKRVEGLTKAVADLLVRQKQVTIGMPPLFEYTIMRPLPSKELRSLIQKAHGGDQSTAMLTQELIVYLAMFIRTEPQLFHEMLRLRVGLIIQVMASELGRSLHCSGDDASEHLLNLSPFEMKTLLQFLLSGKEFQVKSVRSGVVSVSHMKASKKSMVTSHFLGQEIATEEGMEDERQGQWLRRRRLDGALNRVPHGFYPQLWYVIEKCQNLSIEGKVLSQQLTHEMTPGELKFALQVEQVLNSIPQPEYRQLMVEALVVLIAVVENRAVESLGGTINIEHLVHRANLIFLEDQKKLKGISMACCVPGGDNQQRCDGAAGICQNFYDSAPSGNYGTMTYMVRAVASSMDCFPAQDLDCSIS